MLNWGMTLTYTLLEQQGAQVIGDILGGGGGNLGSCTQPTSTGLSKSSSPGNKSERT